MRWHMVLNHTHANTHTLSTHIQLEEKTAGGSELDCDDLVVNNMGDMLINVFYFMLQIPNLARMVTFQKNHHLKQQQNCRIYIKKKKKKAH